MLTHYTAKYLLQPYHAISINLVGCGGTGSQSINNLARLHMALVNMGHPGLMVRAFDPDIVSNANIGRQLFSPSDMGINKAIVLISRINRFFGLNWQAYPIAYTEAFCENNQEISRCNILITAVDTAKARLDIGGFYKNTKMHSYSRDFDTSYYWLDMGNGKSSGQVILGTLNKIAQPKSKEPTTEYLNTVLDLFPNLLDEDTEEIQGPSCSVAESLARQDLFINSTIAQFGINMIWKLFSEVKLQLQGAYINLKTLNSNPIRLS